MTKKVKHFWRLTSSNICFSPGIPFYTLELYTNTFILILTDIYNNGGSFKLQRASLIKLHMHIIHTEDTYKA